VGSAGVIEGNAPELTVTVVFALHSICRVKVAVAEAA
jgi:hypothetical protein